MISCSDIRKKYDKSLLVKSPHYDEEQHACMICTEPATFPVRCNTCKLLLCKVCAKKCQQQMRRCPKKCTEEGSFNFTEEKEFDIELNCPYDKRCEVKITPENFNDHLRTCSFLPEEYRAVKFEEDLKREYLCQKGHPLSFIGYDRVNLVWGRNCMECQTRNLCRSVCDTCTQTFCCACRYPKGLTTRRCPRDHPFLIRDWGLWSVSCDYCSKNVAANGQTFCYNEPICDYAVCQPCYSELVKEQSTAEYEKQDRTKSYRTPAP